MRRASSGRGGWPDRGTPQAVARKTPAGRRAAHPRRANVVGSRQSRRPLTGRLRHDLAPGTTTLARRVPLVVPAGPAGVVPRVLAGGDLHRAALLVARRLVRRTPRRRPLRGDRAGTAVRGGTDRRAGVPRQAA